MDWPHSRIKKARFSPSNSITSPEKYTTFSHVRLFLCKDILAHIRLHRKNFYFYSNILSISSYILINFGWWISVCYCCKEFVSYFNLCYRDLVRTTFLIFSSFPYLYHLISRKTTEFYPFSVNKAEWSLFLYS